ncbi:MAG: hypothetical protein J5953_12645 [Prevotella sp.]|nr:hypothetical protein [Prevotella sp.]
MLKTLKARFDAWNNRHFDKVEHLLAGYALTAGGGLAGGLMGALLCGVAVIVLETLKEWILDTEFDWQDWLWTLGGSAVPVLLSVIGCDSIAA